MRRRPIAPVACALALITGAWFGQAYALFGPPGALMASDPDNRAAEAVVWRFYDAVDILLRTGDDAGLRAALAPEFVDHAPRPGLPPSRDGLLRYLATLPQTFPDLRLAPGEIHAHEDHAVAQVELAGVDDGGFLGIPLDGSSPWSSVDIFHVRGGQIIERWADTTGPVMAEPLFLDTVSVPAGPDRIPSLERVTILPCAVDTRDQYGPAVVLAETGAVDVTLGDALTALAPGEAVVVPADVAFTARNRAETSADVVVLRLEAPAWPAAVGESQPRPEPLPPGITLQLLVHGVSATAGPGTLSVSVGRIAIAPGAQLATHRTMGPELITVAEGTLTAIFPDSTTGRWIHPPDQRSPVSGNLEFLSPASGLSVAPNVVASYRNDQATVLSLLVVTIVPGNVQVTNRIRIP